MDYQKREFVNFSFTDVFKQATACGYQFFKKKIYKPVLKILCMKAILFYQRRLSKHTCLYKPTCSQYTLECINNHGAILGILMGTWRILRCNPLSKGGYDPAPERFFKKRWLL